METHADAEAKRQALVEAVAKAERPGIVYVATRRAADELASRLQSAGVDAVAYHAGLGAARRRDVQAAFMDGRDGVIVATIAFGMGIDKPDVRFVYHLDVSESLDAYHQEIGRAGRDGEPAEARLFYRPEDLGLRRFQSAPARIDEADVRAVLRALRRAGGAATPADVATSARRSRRRTDAVLARLEDEAAIEIRADGTIVPAMDEGAVPSADSIAATVVAGQERRRVVERSRVEMVRAYAEAVGCRRAALLGYFGEPFEPPCGRCDRCRALSPDDARAVAPADPAPFAAGNRVRHATFGAGTVTGIEPDRVTVAFDEVGYRTIALEAVTAVLVVEEPGEGG